MYFSPASFIQSNNSTNVTICQSLSVCNISNQSIPIDKRIKLRCTTNAMLQVIKVETHKVITSANVNYE